jgi:CubicO group peptidase (beta-lactamase class C family)
MGRILGLAFAILLPTSLSAGAQDWSLRDSIANQIDEVFDFVQVGDPGCALGVVQNGRLVFAKGYGLANLGWGNPVSPSTVFDIGSVSKQFTAAAIALLDIDGVLSIDDDVRKWIPELPEYGRTITIRHLLNHTSGIRDYLTLMSLEGIDFDNVLHEIDGVARIVRQRGLNFEPGSEHLYSNSGYLILANVVRRATGRSLRQFLEERVFEPLGMTHTLIWDDNTQVVHERAFGYSGEPDNWSIDHAWNFQMGGDGGVVTSVEDLAKWDANFYDPLVGGQALLDMMHTRGVLNSGDTIDYALGLNIDRYRGMRRVEHGGSWAGFGAVLARFPDHHTSIIVECNRGDANVGSYANEVADAVLAGQFTEAVAYDEEGNPSLREGRKPVVLARDQLARWEGVYVSTDEPSALLFFESRDATLFVQVQQGTFPLQPFSETEFDVVGVGDPVEFAEDGDVVTAAAFGNVYVRSNPIEIPADRLRAYTGSYWSPEVAATYDVTLEDDGLVLRRTGRVADRLVALAPDNFFGSGLGIRFARERRRVTSFEIDAGRARGIVFEKQR